MALNPELVYISGRLAEQVIGRAGQGTVLPIHDPYQLAIAAARATRETIGSLEQPGEFVMAPLPVHAWIFKLKEDGRRVAWLEGDLGSTLVVLCGSAANFLDHAPEPTNRGWWPSSPMGMMRIVDSFAGANREQSQGMLFELDGAAARDAAETAAYVSVGLGVPAALNLGWCGVLFKRYADVDDVVQGPPFTGRRRFDRVVVGAPLMIQRLPAEEELAAATQQ